MENLLDLYTDYLLTTPTQATCTGLSEVLHGQISHDRFTRLLASGKVDSKRLWEQAKPLVAELADSSQCVVLGIDDTIQEKPYSEENELVCWHFDHNEARTVKGINLLSAVLTTDELAVPIAAECIRKPILVPAGSGRLKRKSKVSKHTLFRRLLDQCWQNTWFKYVAADSWFSSKANMSYIKTRLHREFVMALKTNRLVAASQADKQAGRWTSIRRLVAQEHPLQVWLRGMEFPILVVKQVFKNGDGTEGIRYLGASDLNLSSEQILGIYQRRWKTEEYHKSIKQCSKLGASPAHTPATQQAHCMAALMSYVKLEKLKLVHRRNHFALKTQIWIEATRQALQTMSKLSTTPNKYAYLTG